MFQPKQYVTPEVQIVFFTHEQIICLSGETLETMPDDNFSSWED